MLPALLLAASCASAAPVLAAPRPARATPAQLAELRAYVRRSWKTLTRSPADALAAAADAKTGDGARALLYAPAEADVAAVSAELDRTLRPADRARVDVRALPADPVSAPPGLLYLPRPYVVPGGRFNEMYGWDSWFILVGLLRDGETALAKGMTDDFLYEVARYGKVLNANRSYYLTRSQPPFLSEMVLAVHAKTGDKAWLAAARPALEEYHRFWTSGGHLDAKTGLSLYRDAGEGPAPEVLSGERDAAGRTHYDRVKESLKSRELPGYPRARYYDAKADRLTAFFYANDRAMRESGFDPSDRFGPFGSQALDVDPVCLNSLLYRMETDLAEIARALGDAAGARAWTEQAKARAARVNALMWDEKDGLYYDYDREAGTVRRYAFATTFYPLWAGLADARRAARVRGNLARFERPGGLMASPRVSGQQWDAPFAWAPLQMIAVEGLRRYGYGADADRVSVEFLSMILRDFLAHGTIKEKYDATTRRSDLADGLKFGYESNEIGFGWTNAAFEELYERLPEAERAKVLDLDGPPPHARP